MADYANKFLALQDIQFGDQPSFTRPKEILPDRKFWKYYKKENGTGHSVRNSIWPREFLPEMSDEFRGVCNGVKKMNT